jgi:hypothetical protein
MSGPLAQHRPGNRPLVIDGIPVLKFDNRGEPVWKHVLKPGGTYVKGRCVDYQVLRYVATRHVLTYITPADRPSKHAKGRIRPRTKAEQTRARNLQARFVQISKTMTVDHNTLRAIHDEVAA